MHHKRLYTIVLLKKDHHIPKVKNKMMIMPLKNKIKQSKLISALTNSRCESSK